MPEPATAAPSAAQTETLEDWLRRQQAAAGVVGAVGALAGAAAAIADAVRFAPLRGQTGAAGAVNVQGEDQKMLDVISHDLVVDALQDCPHVKLVVSEEVEDVIVNPGADGDARYAACLDPLDGSSNIETDSAIGTIFSILELDDFGAEATEKDVLAATERQAAAGYFLYGPATLLVITTGKSVAMFAQDNGAKGFLLVRDGITIPAGASEFSINVAHRRHWQPPVARYIDECLQGEAGPRNKPYNMRWAGSMVADVHRIFVRGGIFIYPALMTPGGANGKLRLLYEALPMMLLVETAGGAAIAGDAPLRDIRPSSLHQRVPLALGSADEVAYLLALHRNE